MIEHRPFAAIGAADHGWLDAHHHFSFADYQDRNRMNWGALRVWNDDIIAPHTGFSPHPHRDMEIITYVRTGAITYEDSLGNKGRTGTGDVQVMSAGSGITHAEYNREDIATSLFQIWIQTDQRGAPPAWDARPFPKGDRAGSLAVLASGMPGDEGALPIRTPARVLGASLRAGERVTYALDAGRSAYLVPAVGSVSVNGVALAARDGAAIRDEPALTITALDDCEIVMVDSA